LKKPYHILIVDDDADVLTSARLLLKQHFQLVETSEKPSDLNSILSRKSIDLVLLDMNFRKGRNDGEEGLYWLKHIRELSPSTQVVLMTAYGEVALAVRAIKEGAFDFVLKPWTNEKLLATINNALELAREKQKVAKLQSSNKQWEDSVALKEEDLQSRSASMNAVLQTLQKVARTDANILLLGENGTGKSALALSIHRMSARKNESFVTVDLGAISPNLFESELFGHKKGSFTDASEDKQGRFETAHDGSLFLDEIGNLDLSLQSKLLHVLQSQEIRKVGDINAQKVNVRLICATNSPLHDWVEVQRFRQDLLYRINTVEVVVPPLRDRQEDIPLLARTFFDRFCKKYHKENLSLSLRAIDALCEYHWPGNVRELQHSMERAVILSTGKEVKPEDLQLRDGGLAKPSGLNLEEMEKHLVLQALDKHRGNISKAAKDLGLTRAALYRRMEKYEL
jgi:two-component system response regulator HydG